MSSSIFHDYDIRGRYPDQINEAVFYNLGIALAQAFRPVQMAVGRDTRLSSETLFLYLTAGLASQKVKIIDLGKVATPFCLWYSQKYRTDTLVITASHNPKDQNGLKIYSGKSGAVDKNSGLLKIKARLEKLDFNLRPVDIKSARSFFIKGNTAQAFLEYNRYLINQSKGLNLKLKVALDFSSGMAAPELIPVLEKSGLNFLTINEVPNGNFPDHGPNPLEESSQKGLKALIKTKKFDLGAIFDGDADRIVFFDEKGEMIDPSFIFSALIDFYLKPCDSAVQNAALGKIIKEVAEAKGVKLVVCRVGRSNVQRAMVTNKAILGAEKSGHYFFKDFYYGDSAALALLAVLKILSKKKQKLSQLIKPYQKYVIWPEINLPFKGRVEDILNKLKENYKSEKISELDGLTVDSAEWRFNLRKSNTENLWRLNLEGKNKEELEKIKKDVEVVLNFLD